MSIFTTTYIACDGDGYGCPIDSHIDVTLIGEEFGRGRARGAGWNTDGDADLCPACAAALVPALADNR